MKLARHLLPSRGLILVFGAPGSGKDACVGNAILAQAEKEKVPAMILSEAQWPFGRDEAGLGDRSQEKIAALEDLMERALVVMITQRMANLSGELRAFAFSAASVLVVLKSTEAELNRQIVKRTYTKWGFITKQVPDPSTYRTPSFNRGLAEAAICSRVRRTKERLDPDHWEYCSFTRLPIVKLSPSHSPARGVPPAKLPGNEGLKSLAS